MHRAADTVSASIKVRDSYESPAHPLGEPLRTVSVKKDDGDNNRRRRISSDAMDQSVISKCGKAVRQRARLSQTPSIKEGISR